MVGSLAASSTGPVRSGSVDVRPLTPGYRVNGYVLFGRRRGGGGWFADRRGGGGGFRGRFGWLRRRIGGPEMTVALRALPELIRRPWVLGRRVFQVHLGAASLATHADVGMVHAEILVHLRCRVTRDGAGR